MLITINKAVMRKECCLCSVISVYPYLSGYLKHPYDLLAIICSHLKVLDINGSLDIFHSVMAVTFCDLSLL